MDDRRAAINYLICPVQDTPMSSVRGAEGSAVTATHTHPQQQKDCWLHTCREIHKINNKNKKKKWPKKNLLNPDLAKPQDNAVAIANRNHSCSWNMQLASHASRCSSCSSSSCCGINPAASVGVHHHHHHHHCTTTLCCTPPTSRPQTPYVAVRGWVLLDVSPRQAGQADCGTVAVREGCGIFRLPACRTSQPSLVVFIPRSMLRHHPGGSVLRIPSITRVWVCVCVCVCVCDTAIPIQSQAQPSTPACLHPSKKNEGSNQRLLPLQGCLPGEGEPLVLVRWLFLGGKRWKGRGVLGKIRGSKNRPVGIVPLRSSRCGVHVWVTAGANWGAETRRRKAVCTGRLRSKEGWMHVIPICGDLCME